MSTPGERLRATLHQAAALERQGVLMMQQPAGWRGLNWPGMGMSGTGVKCGRCCVKSEAQNHDVNRVAPSACAAGTISKCKENFAWTAVVIWLFLGAVVVMFWFGRGVGRWLSRLGHDVISGLM